VAVDYPTSLDDFTNPLPTDEMDDEGLFHDVHHSDLNDAIEALESKVGIDDSDVTSSLDYKSRKGSFIRATTEATTDNTAAGATDSGVDIPVIGKGSLLVKLATDYPAWVRIYASDAARTADASRTRTTDPEAGSGVLLEVITVSGELTVALSPAAIAYNLEAVPETSLPIAVTNDDSESREITVTVTYVPIEG
jgi:hypothetical protein